MPSGLFWRHCNKLQQIAIYICQIKNGKLDDTDKYAFETLVIVKTNCFLSYVSKVNSSKIFLSYVADEWWFL